MVVVVEAGGRLTSSKLCLGTASTHASINLHFTGGCRFRVVFFNDHPSVLLLLPNFNKHIHNIIIFNHKTCHGEIQELIYKQKNLPFLLRIAIYMVMHHSDEH